MISNPGQSVSPTVMQTSVYDTNNKHQDIFQYTDSKVADKVTSTQVASQISSATANFVTSSQVDAKITSHKNDPYMWQDFWPIPFTGNMFSMYNNATHTSTYSNSFTAYTEKYFLKPFPVALNLTKYTYELYIELYGLSWKKIGSDGSANFRFEFCRTLPSSSADTYKYDDISNNLYYTSTGDIDASFPSPLQFHYILGSSKTLLDSSGYNYYVNGNLQSGWTHRSPGIINALDSYIYTHIGCNLGNIQTINSSGTTYNRQVDYTTFGYHVRYRAYSAK